MKNVFTPAACVLTLLTFPFFSSPQPSSLKKISGNLYEVKTTGSINASGQAKLKTILSREYGIKSFSEAVTVHYSPEKGLKGDGMAMAEEKLSSSAFEQTILEDGDEEVKQSCIYINCSANPAMGDILQVLTTYNAR